MASPRDFDPADVPAPDAAGSLLQHVAAAVHESSDYATANASEDDEQSLVDAAGTAVREHHGQSQNPHAMTQQQQQGAYLQGSTGPGMTGGGVIGYQPAPRASPPDTGPVQLVVIDSDEEDEAMMQAAPVQGSEGPVTFAARAGAAAISTTAVIGGQQAALLAAGSTKQHQEPTASNQSAQVRQQTQPAYRLNASSLQVGMNVPVVLASGHESRGPGPPGPTSSLTHAIQTAPAIHNHPAHGVSERKETNEDEVMQDTDVVRRAENDNPLPIPENHVGGDLTIHPDTIIQSQHKGIEQQAEQTNTNLDSGHQIEPVGALGGLVKTSAVCMPASGKQVVWLPPSDITPSAILDAFFQQSVPVALKGKTTTLHLLLHDMSACVLGFMCDGLPPPAAEVRVSMTTPAFKPTGVDVDLGVAMSICGAELDGMVSWDDCVCLGRDWLGMAPGTALRQVLDDILAYAGSPHAEHAVVDAISKRCSARMTAATAAAEAAIQQDLQQEATKLGINIDTAQLGARAGNSTVVTAHTLRQQQHEAHSNAVQQLAMHHHALLQLRQQQQQQTKSQSSRKRSRTHANQNVAEQQTAAAPERPAQRQRTHAAAPAHAIANAPQQAHAKEAIQQQRHSTPAPDDRLHDVSRSVTPTLPTSHTKQHPHTVAHAAAIANDPLVNPVNANSTATGNAPDVVFDPNNPLEADPWVQAATRRAHQWRSTCVKHWYPFQPQLILNYVRDSPVPVFMRSQNIICHALLPDFFKLLCQWLMGSISSTAPLMVIITNDTYVPVLGSRLVDAKDMQRICGITARSKGWLEALKLGCLPDKPAWMETGCSLHTVFRRLASYYASEDVYPAFKAAVQQCIYDIARNRDTSVRAQFAPESAPAAQLQAPAAPTGSDTHQPMKTHYQLQKEAAKAAAAAVKASVLGDSQSAAAAAAGPNANNGNSDSSTAAAVAAATALLQAAAAHKQQGDTQPQQVVTLDLTRGASSTPPTANVDASKQAANKDGNSMEQHEVDTAQKRSQVLNLDLSSNSQQAQQQRADAEQRGRQRHVPPLSGQRLTSADRVVQRARDALAVASSSQQTAAGRVPHVAKNSNTANTLNLADASTDAKTAPSSLAPPLDLSSPKQAGRVPHMPGTNNDHKGPPHLPATLDLSQPQKAVDHAAQAPMISLRVTHAKGPGSGGKASAGLNLCRPSTPGLAQHDTQASNQARLTLDLGSAASDASKQPGSHGSAKGHSGAVTLNLSSGAGAIHVKPLLASQQAQHTSPGKSKQVQKLSGFSLDLAAGHGSGSTHVSGAAQQGHASSVPQGTLNLDLETKDEPQQGKLSITLPPVSRSTAHAQQEEVDAQHASQGAGSAGSQGAVNLTYEDGMYLANMLRPVKVCYWKDSAHHCALFINFQKVLLGLYKQQTSNGAAADVPPALFVPSRAGDFKPLEPVLHQSAHMMCGRRNWRQSMVMAEDRLDITKGRNIEHFVAAAVKEVTSIVNKASQVKQIQDHAATTTPEPQARQQLGSSNTIPTAVAGFKQEQEQYAQHGSAAAGKTSAGKAASAKRSTSSRRKKTEGAVEKAGSAAKATSSKRRRKADANSDPDVRGPPSVEAAPAAPRASSRPQRNSKRKALDLAAFESNTEEEDDEDMLEAMSDVDEDDDAAGDEQDDEQQSEEEDIDVNVEEEEEEEESDEDFKADRGHGSSKRSRARSKKSEASHAMVLDLGVGRSSAAARRVKAEPSLGRRHSVTSDGHQEVSHDAGPGVAHTSGHAFKYEVPLVSTVPATEKLQVVVASEVNAFWPPFTDLLDDAAHQPSTAGGPTKSTAQPRTKPNEPLAVLDTGRPMTRRQRALVHSRPDTSEPHVEPGAPPHADAGHVPSTDAATGCKDADGNATTVVVEPEAGRSSRVSGSGAAGGRARRSQDGGGRSGGNRRSGRSLDKRTPVKEEQATEQNEGGGAAILHVDDHPPALQTKQETAAADAKSSLQLMVQGLLSKATFQPSTAHPEDSDGDGHEGQEEQHDGLQQEDNDDLATLLGSKGVAGGIDDVDHPLEEAVELLEDDWAPDLPL